MVFAMETVWLNIIPFDVHINNSGNYSNEFKKNDSEHPNYFTKR